MLETVALVTPIDALTSKHESEIFIWNALNLVWDAILDGTQITENLIKEKKNLRNEKKKLENLKSLTTTNNEGQTDLNKKTFSNIKKLF